MSGPQAFDSTVPPASPTAETAVPHSERTTATNDNRITGPAPVASPSWDRSAFLTPPALPIFAHQDHIPDPVSSRAVASPTAGTLQENYNTRSRNAPYSLAPHGPFTVGHDPANLFKGLHIRTDFEPPGRPGSTNSVESESRLRTSASAASLPRRVPSVRAQLHSTAGSLSPGSALSSPQIAAMLDITPLPSPTLGTFESWKSSRTRSRGSSTSSKSEIPSSSAAYISVSLSPTSPRRKGYPGLTSPSSRPSTSDGAAPVDDTRSRARSVSEYVPEVLAVPKPRHVAVSGTAPPPGFAALQSALHREEYLGVQRGLVTPVVAPPSPPATSSELSSSHEDEPAAKRPKLEIFAARSISTGQIRTYESIRELGQGTFSKVYLAVRQVHGRSDTVDYRQDSVNMAGVRARSRRLVAVKVVEHGPAGGADAERIDVSLRREVDLLKCIRHPSLVHLKAFGTDGDSRALLIMNYCPGGDLFEVASKQLKVLTPPLVRRIFSELVSAVRYLHQKYIVHRDIKLESMSTPTRLPSRSSWLIFLDVLLNIPVQVHPDVPDWQTLDRAVVTLTDLGLSRRIPEPPESPLLTTRCGSEDYAAPEILMGQPYDGRETDAWALGVLLYALMEGRLPFDPLPGARGDPAMLRARTPHRIARCEWAWVKYGDENGDWDPDRGRLLQGAFMCVDGLLKRNTRRKPLSEIRELVWVKDGIQVDGGLRWVEEEAI